MTDGGRLLEGNVALIVGGGTGIGRAAATLFARHGAELVVTARTESSLQETCDLAREVGGSASYVVGDVGVPADIERMFDHVLERHGRIDTLLVVAGISGRRFGDGPAHECTEAGWDTVMDVNAKGTFLCCKRALGVMMEQGAGSVITMSSVLGLSPSAEHFGTHAYAGSKGAIISFSRAMAAYYAPHGIRVNVLAPGLIATPMSGRAQSDPEIKAFMKGKQPLTGAMGTPDDVAGCALFLASDLSRFVTGVVLPVDGGWTVSG